MVMPRRSMRFQGRAGGQHNDKSASEERRGRNHYTVTNNTTSPVSVHGLANCHMTSEGGDVFDQLPAAQLPRFRSASRHQRWLAAVGWKRPCDTQRCAVL